MNVTAIIPAYNPDKKFHVVIEGLVQAGFEHIIVVNDGTSEKYINLFDKVKRNKKCVFLEHEINLGKGRALKTAFKYFLKNFPDDIGVVTLDADNQHKVNDVIKCANELKKHTESLIIGSRNFNLENVPKRSSLGNKITSFAFSALCGINITDTQSGLRAIPRKFVEKLINVKGERFEFETNMLLETKVQKIPIREVNIETVYINGNTSSNFNPLLDSFNIYKVIFKFLFSSGASIICDYLLFILLGIVFSFLPQKIELFISIFGARIISSIVNFNINRKVVFKNSDNIKRLILKYYLLVAIIMTCSYLGVYFLTVKFAINELLAKVIIDIILFIASFKVQINWVFK